MSEVKHRKFTSFKVRKVVKAKGVLGIQLFITENGLRNSEPTIQINSTSKSTNQSTIKNYYNIWEELWKFSMLPICEYMTWKTSPQDVAVLDHHTKLPAKDVEGKTVMGLGSWNAPVTLLKFHAAVLALHDPYQDIRGQYSSVCTTWVQLNDEYRKSPNYGTGTFSSCDTHPGIDHHLVDQAEYNELVDVLKNKVAPDLAIVVKDLFEKAVKEQVRKAIALYSLASASTDSMCTSTGMVANEKFGSDLQELPKKRIKGGDMEIPLRADFKPGMTNEKKLEMLIQIEQQVQGTGNLSSYTNNARLLYQKCT